MIFTLTRHALWVNDNGAKHCPRLEESTLLPYALVFLVIAIIAALFGFTGIAGTAAGIAKILFIIFLILAEIAYYRRARTSRSRRSRIAAALPPTALKIVPSASSRPPPVR